MKIINKIESLSPKNKLILTIGMFDGVHRGHQSIIQKINTLAKERGGHSALLSFHPHPRLVLQPDSDLKLLTTPREKQELLASYNLDYLIVQPFDFDFSRISSLSFVRDYLVQKLHINTLIVGHDHHFGRNRTGNFTHLTELAELYNFEALQLSAIMENELPISSTKIRHALQEANMTYVTESLGHPYQISGTVMHGDKIGRTLNFPTINLNIDKHKLLPKNGVYGTHLNIEGKTYFGLMNIGTRPSLDGENKRVEIYVLDFNQEIYGKYISAKILCFIRDEIKFDSLDHLKNQIEKDVIYFKNNIKQFKP